MAPRLASLFLLGLLAVSCTDKDKKPPVDKDPVIVEPGELDGACSEDTHLGGFTVAISPAYSLVEGSVASGVLPQSALDWVSTSGTCELLQRPVLACDPACESDETCNKDLQCIPYPRNQDVGDVDIFGLVTSVHMEALAPGNTYFDSDVPNPVFEPLKPMLLQSTSGYFGKLSLSGDGVAPLELTTTDWVLDVDQALALAWTPPPEGARSEIVAELTVDQHGSSPILVRCLFPDTGAAEVPGDVVTALINAGVSGFPNGSLTRRTADSVVVDAGCIDFTAESRVAADVSVSGFTPCDSEADCPGPATCNLTLHLCE